MSDNDNVWEQPSAPPPPLFTGKKEKDLVKQVTDELTERVIKSEVVYYPISLKHSSYHSLSQHMSSGKAQKLSLPILVLIRNQP
jgi:hypothetical protein